MFTYRIDKFLFLLERRVVGVREKSIGEEMAGSVKEKELLYKIVRLFPWLTLEEWWLIKRRFYPLPLSVLFFTFQLYVWFVNDNVYLKTEGGWRVYRVLGTYEARSLSLCGRSS